MIWTIIPTRQSIVKINSTFREFNSRILLTKAIVSLSSSVKKRIIFLHENTHHIIPYKKNYFFLDM